MRNVLAPLLFATLILGSCNVNAAPTYPLAFNNSVESAQDLKRRQMKWRKVLGELLHFNKAPLGYSPEYTMLAPPDADSSTPTVLVVPGHSYGARTILEPYRGPGTDAGMDGNVGVGHYLWARGYRIVTLDLLYQGSRATEDASGLHTNTHNHAGDLLIEQGSSLTEIHVKEVLSVLDRVKALPEVDSSNIVAIGLSQGASVAAIVGALDEDVRAVYAAGPTVSYCYLAGCAVPPEYVHDMVPGFHDYGDYVDILALIAPRPLLVTYGARNRSPVMTLDRDSGFTSTYLSRVYQVADAPDSFHYITPDAGHAFYIPALEDFLLR